MKKFLLLLSIMFLPINAIAYSDYIYRGGNTLGIETNFKGVLLVGFYEVNGKYNKGNPELKVGDYIIKVNEKNVNSIEELTKELESLSDKEKIIITYTRDKKEYSTIFELINDNGVYKTGLYVKDNITGIGTLTYIDPESKIYGALGHEIIDSNSKKIVEVKDGVIFKNYIIGIDKSQKGHAGAKQARYFYNTVFGNIYKNTTNGIFGNYSGPIDDFKLVKVGEPKDIKIGKAKIYTSIKDDIVEEFSINITSINENANIKNITFEITDKELLEKTGGVVQGMSGSPIIQNDTIIGVVTHVIVDNPNTGYGLFITTMLKEGEK